MVLRFELVMDGDAGTHRVDIIELTMPDPGDQDEMTTASVYFDADGMHYVNSRNEDMVVHDMKDVARVYDGSVKIYDREETRAAKAAGELHRRTARFIRGD